MNKQYECKKCNYATSLKHNYNKHMTSNKHKANGKHGARYKCAQCNFYADDMSNYKKHTLTQKHQIKCNTDDELIDGQLIDENELFDMSSAIVEYNPNAQQMMTTTNTDKDKDLMINSLVQLLAKTNDVLISQIEIKDKQIEIKDKQINNKDKQIKTSFGLLKHLVVNYSDAPPFEKISDLTFIKDVTECRSRMPELLIEYYKTDKFVPYLAENIVKIYKKDDPKEQSLWTSDASRDNFIVKNKINDKESKWIRDIKGAMMIENAIRPCLNLILEELKWYFGELTNGMSYKNKLHPSLMSMSIMLEMRQAICDKNIEEDIRKRLSPEFCFPNTAIKTK
jgi:hypothetical protein